MRKLLRWIPLILVLVLALGGIGFVVWASSTPASMPEAQAAVQSSTSAAYGLVFAPEGEQPTTGFIFYPGGRVAPESYAPALNDIAEAGYLVVAVPMPLNLAVFGIERASEVISAHPEIERWVIGGHSLGGSMAARYAYNHPDTINGLVLWASYPEAALDFSDRAIKIATIYGTLDGLATTNTIDESLRLLPQDALVVPVDGGNHAQFGWYGAQAGDNDATITHEAQQAAVVAATIDLLAQTGTP